MKKFMLQQILSFKTKKFNYWRNVKLRHPIQFDRLCYFFNLRQF